MPAPAVPPPIQHTQHTASGDAFLDVRMTIDNAALTVADRVHLTLACTTRSSAELKLSEFGPTLGDFNVVSADSTERRVAGGRETTVAFVLEPFLAGDKSIPPIPVRSIDGGRTLSLNTEPATLKVAAVAPADATDKSPLEPLKSPVALLTPIRVDRTRLWIILGCSGLAIVSAFASIALTNARRARREADPLFRVRRKLEQVRAALAQATTRADASRACDDLFRALAEHLRDTRSIPADTQPHARIAPLITALESMSFDDRTALSGLLADLERTRFAPDATSVPIVQSLLDRTAALVDRIARPPTAEGHR